MYGGNLTLHSVKFTCTARMDTTGAHVNQTVHLGLQSAVCMKLAACGLTSWAQFHHMSPKYTGNNGACKTMIWRH